MTQVEPAEAEREGGREDVVHVDRLKRFRSPRTDSSSLTQRSNPVAVPVPAGAGAAGETADGVGLTGFEDIDGAVSGRGQSEGETKLESSGVRKSDEDARAEEEAEGSYEVPPRTPRGEPQVEYLVKWKHWPDTENQWVPRENLLASAGELLREFEDAGRVRERAIRARRRAIMADAAGAAVMESASSSSSA